MTSLQSSVQNDFKISPYHQQIRYTHLCTNTEGLLLNMAKTLLEEDKKEGDLILFPQRLLVQMESWQRPPQLMPSNFTTSSLVQVLYWILLHSHSLFVARAIVPQTWTELKIRCTYQKFNALWRPSLLKRVSMVYGWHTGRRRVFVHHRTLAQMWQGSWDSSSPLYVKGRGHKLLASTNERDGEIDDISNAHAIDYVVELIDSCVGWARLFNTRNACKWRRIPQTLPLRINGWRCPLSKRQLQKLRMKVMQQSIG